jgi:hypothetical protein
MNRWEFLILIIVVFLAAFSITPIYIEVYLLSYLFHFFLIPIVKNKWFLCDVKQYLHFKNIVTDDFFAEAFLLNGLPNNKK